MTTHSPDLARAELAGVIGAVVGMRNEITHEQFVNVITNAYEQYRNLRDGMHIVRLDMSSPTPEGLRFRSGDVPGGAR